MGSGVMMAGGGVNRTDWVPSEVRSTMTLSVSLNRPPKARGVRANPMYMVLPAHASVRQVFPDPRRPEHVSHAAPWAVERLTDTVVRIHVDEVEHPSARIFEVFSAK
ncbi:hypothetical protein [Bifidobacterium olomucense]|uniref:hypothetical protein n=1 Tax=Bifidobacterium olomucense TaxID=2675324 RepID=UPI001F0EB2D4|nr:hypothetical protein [Bifidobacterium sp. DSM 109959]